MKRLIGVALALSLVLGLVAVAGAEDRLTINGDYYLRGIYIDNKGNSPTAPEDEYFIQRLRTDMKMALSETMTLQLRADWAENAWGENNHPVFATPELGAGPTIFNILQIEYANVKINKELWYLSVGLDSSFDYGLGDVYRPHGYGFKLRLKTPVVIALDLTKFDEGGARTDDEANEDTNFYSLQVSTAVAGWSVGAFYANRHDLEVETMHQAVEVFGRGKMGPVNLAAAVDYIFGERTAGGAEQDLAGTVSAIVSGDIAITPAFKLGTDLYYTMSNDDANEAAIGELFVWGPAANFISRGLPGLTWDGIGYEIGFHNRTVISGDPGQYGADLWGNFTIGKVTLGAQVAYFTAADDDEVAPGGAESILGFGAGASYAYAPGVIIALGGVYADKDLVQRDADAAIGVQANFWVLF